MRSKNMKKKLDLCKNNVNKRLNNEWVDYNNKINN